MQRSCREELAQQGDENVATAVHVCVVVKTLMFHPSTWSITSARADASGRDELCYCCGHKQPNRHVQLKYRSLTSSGKTNMEAIRTAC